MIFTKIYDEEEILKFIYNNYDKMSQFEDEATHSRDFSHELVASYIRIKTFKCLIKILVV